MDAEKATYGIARMARLLNVSRSGYYARGARDAAGPSPAQQRRETRTATIAALHADSDGVYGSPRILADLREAGERISAKTVTKLMRRHGIIGISPRRYTPVTTVHGPNPAPVPDRYNRRRCHSSIGMISPVRFEAAHPRTAPAA